MIKGGIEITQYPINSVYILEYELRDKNQSDNDRPRHRGNFILDVIDSKTDPKLLILNLTGWRGKIKTHVAERVIHKVSEVLEMESSCPYYPWFQSLSSDE